MAWLFASQSKRKHGDSFSVSPMLAHRAAFWKAGNGARVDIKNIFAENCFHPGQPGNKFCPDQTNWPLGACSCDQTPALPEGGPLPLLLSSQKGKSSVCHPGQSRPWKQDCYASAA